MLKGPLCIVDGIRWEGANRQMECFFPKRQRVVPPAARQVENVASLHDEIHIRHFWARMLLFEVLALLHVERRIHSWFVDDPALSSYQLDRKYIARIPVATKRIFFTEGSIGTGYRLPSC